MMTDSSPIGRRMKKYNSVYRRGVFLNEAIRRCNILLALKKTRTLAKAKGWINFNIIQSFCANVRAIILSILFI